MFRLLFRKYNQSTFFEKLLLVLGVAVGVIGFWLINRVYVAQNNEHWPFITAVFLWLILIFIFVLTDSNESIKEELSKMMKEQVEETRLLRKEIAVLKDSKGKKKR